MAGGSRGDIATGYIISENAERVFEQCVVGQGKGGTVKYFSEVLS